MEVYAVVFKKEGQPVVHKNSQVHTKHQHGNAIIYNTDWTINMQAQFAYSLWKTVEKMNGIEWYKNSSRLHSLCTKQYTGTRQSRLCDAGYDSFPLCNGVCHRASLKTVAGLLKGEWKTRRTGCSRIDQHWPWSRMELEVKGDQRLG